MTENTAGPDCPAKQTPPGLTVRLTNPLDNTDDMWQTLQQSSESLLNTWTDRFVLEAATGYFMMFLLVLVRLSGLFLIGPYFAHAAIPTQTKALLVLSLALLVTPALTASQQRGFDQLDVDHNHLLTDQEIPRGVEMKLQTDTGQPPVVTKADFVNSVAMPKTLFDLLWVCGTELMIGMVLGLGVIIILAGLQLAGEMFDQQTGTALSEIFNPALGTSASPTGQMLFVLGTTTLLMMPPFDAHLMMLMHLLRTFEIIPVGLAYIDVSTLDLLWRLMSQSLILAVQISAPLLAAMSLLSVAMGFLGYTVPQINVLVLGFPIRVILSMIILLVTFSGATAAILEIFPQVLNSLTDSLIAAGKGIPAL